MKTQKCEYCSKEITGYNQKHIDYIMMQHILSKHKEMIKVKGE